MSYASTSLLLQAAQYQQLQAINRTMWLQQAEEQRQRYLSDVLLAATQGSERVARTGRHDPIAAAILASRWLRTLGWLHAGLLSDFPRKQTWEQCRMTFVQACDAVRSEDAVTTLIRDYLAAEEREFSLLTAFGNCTPEGAAGTATQLISKAARVVADKQSNVVNRRVYIGIAIFLCISATELVGQFVSSALAIFIAYSSVFTMLFVAPISLRRAGRARTEAEAHEKHLRDCWGEWQTLEHSERGLSLLANVRGAHPYILEQAPAAPPTSHTVERHTIDRQTVERQVVVARCRYCASLTPVDVSNCRVCGSHKPI